MPLTQEQLEHHLWGAADSDEDRLLILEGHFWEDVQRKTRRWRAGRVGSSVDACSSIS